MKNVYDAMKNRQITLPEPPPKGGIYTPVQEFGNHLLYCSGCGSTLSDGRTVVGKLGELSIEQGQKAAYFCMLNLLANLQDKLGDLNRITRFVKMLAFVNCTADFDRQPQVVNGASQLLESLFGDEIGKPARSAIGTNSLPGNVTCEIELLVEYR